MPWSLLSGGRSDNSLRAVWKLKIVILNVLVINEIQLGRLNSVKSILGLYTKY